MPSPFPRMKRGNARRAGIGRQKNFKPALKAVNTLIVDIENSESPEDEEAMSETYDQKLSSSASNVTGSNIGNRSAANRVPSPNPFLKQHRLLEEFDGDSESEDSEGDFEKRSEARVLTEVERLEEAQTALEDKVKETKVLLQRKDRTRNQRIQAQQKLARLEAKLEMLDQRLEAERSGKTRWTFIKRVVRKPKVGFHSSELLKRKMPLQGLLAASLDTQAGLAGEVEIQDMESKSEEDVQLEENSSSKPQKMFKTKALQEFNLSLQEKPQDKQKEAKSCEDAVNASKRDECRKGDNDAVLDEMKDRKEVDKGWLRISDRPKDFVKKIDISETHQTKEAWVNISQQGQQMFARKVFRAHMNGNDPRLSNTLKGKAKRTVSGVLGERLTIGDRRASKSSSEKSFDINKEKSKQRSLFERVSSASSRRPRVVRMENIGGTTSFLPPIPKYEAKKRPKQEQIDRATDENDVELKKERMILIPNRRRVAKRRAELYLKQLEFVRAHGLDKKEVLKHVGEAIKEHRDSEDMTGEHQPSTTPRSTLYLIGALSRTHLRPPTAHAPQINES